MVVVVGGGNNEIITAVSHWALTEYLACSPHFTALNSFSPSDSHMRWVLLLSSWATERPGNSPKVTELVSATSGYKPGNLVHRPVLLYTVPRAVRFQRILGDFRVRSHFQLSLRRKALCRRWGFGWFWRLKSWSQLCWARPAAASVTTVHRAREE